MIEAKADGALRPYLGPEGRPGAALIRGKDVNRALPP